jgi:hypothetical protein
LTKRRARCSRAGTPGDKRGEAAGIFLDLAHDVEVIHALFDGLAGPNIMVAVERKPTL